MTRSDEVYEEYYSLNLVQIKFGQIAPAACATCFITGEIIAGMGGGEGISLDLYNRIKSGAVKVIDENGNQLNSQ
ncbi:hypothetical protein phiOC_p168 [Ochrobactrum phage vB_OspM_OC]|nr:hypothetical protein phiOC_p168 [Ochrobactrum phage vB_OspM_OC]